MTVPFTNGFDGDPIAGEPMVKAWWVLGNVLSTFEAETAKAGRISFLIAGKIEETSFGFGRRKTLTAAATPDQFTEAREASRPAYSKMPSHAVRPEAQWA